MNIQNNTTFSKEVIDKLPQITRTRRGGGILYIHAHPEDTSRCISIWTDFDYRTSEINDDSRERWRQELNGTY